MCDCSGIQKGDWPIKNTEKTTARKWTVDTMMTSIAIHKGRQLHRGH